MKVVRESEGRSGFLSRFLCTVLIVLVIVLVSLLFAVRTEGARDLIEEWLTDFTGVPLTVEETRIGWPYVLVAQGVDSDNFENDVSAGLRVHQIRIGLNGSGLHITAKRPELKLCFTKDGNWTPERFARMGDIPFREISAVTSLTSGFRKRVRLDISDGVITWRDADGVQKAYARGIDFSMRPLSIPSGKLFYYALDVRSASIPSSRQESRSMRREWVSSASRDYIEIDSVDGSAVGLDANVDVGILERERDE